MWQYFDLPYGYFSILEEDNAYFESVLSIMELYNNVMLCRKLYSRIRSSSAEDCWLWDGATDKDGYGVLYWLGKVVRAHRLSLAVFLGEDIPSEVLVLHSCDNPRCCNPQHLRKGTHADNVKDKISRYRCSMPSGENHWKSKITSQDADNIRALYAQGNTQTSIAHRYSLAQSQVSRIVNGKAW